MDKRTVASAHERIDDMQIQVAEIRTEVKIQFKEVFACVKHRVHNDWRISFYYCDSGYGADADALKPASTTDIVGPSLFA